MKLLKKLYLIDAKSGSEKAQRDFIIKYVKDHIKGAVSITDNKGNLYVTKGQSETYPCVVSHLDEVHQKRHKSFKIIESDGFIMGMNVYTRERHGIGADDKNGIWVCLKCLEKFDAIKCAFFVQEETGCIGSGQANMEFFSNCRFVVQCDRKNNGDFINKISGVELCSKDFINDAKLKDFGYKATEGALTDSYKLKMKGLKVSCCNMSCGYYEPHTSSEYTYFPDLQKCLNLVEHIVANCTKVYAHEYKPVYQHRYYNEFDDSAWYPRNGNVFESYAQKLTRKIKEYLENNSYDNMLDAWIDARKEFNKDISFEYFTDSWTEYQLEQNAAELAMEVEQERNAVV